MELIDKATIDKLRGGFYTPELLTDFIINWLGNETFNTALEPSCGDGGFLKSIAKYNLNIKQLTAIELIPEELKKAKTNSKNLKNLNFINGDFWKLYTKDFKYKKFDLIIGNPPYIRYQYLTEEQRQEHTVILKENGMKPNKLINAWVSFLVACVNMLDNNGKIGMVIPAELLQVAYAKELRLFLSKNLSKISIISFKKLVFPDIQQEVVLFLAEKKIEEIKEDKINICFLETLDATTLKNDYFNNNLKFKHLEHTTEKWTKYYLSPEEIIEIDNIKKKNIFLKLKDIATVQVGITTGNNKYFSIDSNTVKKYCFDNVVLPLIGRSAHIDKLYFDKEMWDKNKEAGVRAYLLNFPDKPFNEYLDSHKEYIFLGEMNNENKGYKCKIRERWYRIPSIWSPDAFILRRSNEYPKFVINKIDAVSTDTMHRVRFHSKEDLDWGIIGYYNSVSFAFTELEARSYGGGVLEILPNEAEEVLIAKLDTVDKNSVNLIKNHINNLLIAKTSIDEILDYTDNEILIKILNLEESSVRIFRNIWKKLQKRRIERT